MSYDENELRKIIREFIRDKDKASFIFQVLELQSKVRDQEVKQYLKDVNDAKKKIQGNQDGIYIIQLLEKITQESKSSNDIFRFILYVLEAIVLERPKSITYEEQKMLTDKDRKALDWIHKYMEHSKNED